MALSNIFREPRREITETVVGVCVGGPVIAGLLWLDYWFAINVCGADSWSFTSREAPIPVAMIFGLLCGFITCLIAVGLAVAIHGLGDRVCNVLDQSGLRLRPKQRY